MIPKHVKLKVFEKCNHKCVKCGSTDDLTIDHLIPKHSGGSSEEWNLAAMCYGCNQIKSDTLSTHWYDLALNQKREYFRNLPKDSERRPIVQVLKTKYDVSNLKIKHRSKKRTKKMKMQ